MHLSLNAGTPVVSSGRSFVILQALDFESVLAQDVATGKPEKLAICELRPQTDTNAQPEIDLGTVLGDEWDEARQRYEIVKPLLELPRLTRRAVVEAAKASGKHWATLYRWIRTYRDSGRVSSLLPTGSDGGRGKSRLDQKIDAVIEATIGDFYLTRERRTVQAACDEVLRRCRNAGITPPHPNTVRNRIAAIGERTRLERRGHSKELADRFTARPGRYDDAATPLSVLQIDHTRMDIIAVDSIDRMPIGRPWLTLAIDVYSRMVAGFYLTFDPPSALSVGLCIAHAILPKEQWLAARSITHRWPCWGVPRAAHWDNGKDFRSEAVRRACEEYGIEVNFRPVKTPHFGGHIERMLGTLMHEIHALPGTTFSNPTERGELNADQTAALTIDEIEVWITELICGIYHQRVHSATGTTPLHRYDEGIFGTKDRPGIGAPARVLDEERVRLDFMPHVERTIQSYGIVIDDIHYYSDVLRPYVGASDPDNRKLKRKFVFKRDPRDVSRVYFYDPELKQYSAVPYRNTSYPAISIWELRKAQQRVVDEGRREVDEAAIFEAYERMRDLEASAKSATKTIRLARERRARRPAPLRLVAPKEIPPPSSDDEPIEPFEDLEEL